MMDIVYISVVALFFLLTRGLMGLCHRLAGPGTEERS